MSTVKCHKSTTKVSGQGGCVDSIGVDYYVSLRKRKKILGYYEQCAKLCTFYRTRENDIFNRSELNAYVSYQCLKIDRTFYLMVLWLKKGTPCLFVNLFYLSNLSGMQAKEG